MRYGGNRYVKSFPCLSQFLCMAVAQLAYRESLRDIEPCLRAQRNQLYHMGIRGKIALGTSTDTRFCRFRASPFSKKYHYFLYFRKRITFPRKTIHQNYVIHLRNHWDTGENIRSGLMELNNQLAIVTGGASGLGAGAVRVLANAGAKIAIFDGNHTDGEELAKEVSGHFYKVDVTSESQVEQAIADCRIQIGHPRILVNAAGIVRNFEVLDEELQPHPLQDFVDIINVNLVGTFNCIRLFAAAAASAPALDEEERGVVINISSVSGFEGVSNQAAYSASKSGVIGLTLAVARSLCKWGIRVVTIAPGLFNTPMISAYPHGPQALMNAARKSTPYPARLGEPYEFGELVVAICKIRYLNGEVIRLDGALRPAFFDGSRSSG